MRNTDFLLLKPPLFSYIISYLYFEVLPNIQKLIRGHPKKTSARVGEGSSTSGHWGRGSQAKVDVHIWFKFNFKYLIQIARSR